jgi:hypothetical protein
MCLSESPAGEARAGSRQDYPPGQAPRRGSGLIHVRLLDFFQILVSM